MSMNRVTKRKPYAYGCLYPVACFWLTSTYEIVYLTKIAYILPVWLTNMLSGRTFMMVWAILLSSDSNSSTIIIGLRCGISPLIPSPCILIVIW